MEDLHGINVEEQTVPEEHSKFIDAVTQLDRKQRVQVSQRNEPSLSISEFHLIKSGITNADQIQTSELLKTLGQKNHKTKIAELFKTSKQKCKVLPKSLEKVTAEKVKREIGFDNVKNELQKWHAVVSQNRVADSISFPLNHGSMKSERTDNFVKRFRIQSDLEKELNSLESKVENTQEENDNIQMSLEELLLRRAEIAKFRAQQSYKISKDYRQKKIKSKKYHRIERKSKQKNQLKELEQLKKSDPLAAYEKLKFLEKVRSEERMTLRHKNTGHWARNKLIRAKYDKESRQELSKQLSVGRELTQKTLDTENIDDEVVDMNSLSVPHSFTENPWINIETGSEMQQFINDYNGYCNKKVENAPEENKANHSTQQGNKIKNDSKNKMKSKSTDNLPIKSTQVLKSSEKQSVGTSNWLVTDVRQPKQLKDHDNKEQRVKKRTKSIKLESNKRKKSNTKERVSSSDDNIKKTEILHPEGQKEKMNANTVKEIKSKYIKTQLPGTDSSECEKQDNCDDDKKEDKYSLLYEAFSDEDVVEEFRKEKEEEIKKSIPEDINLALPGWGSWGGNNTKQFSKKKKRFTVKFNKDVVRKDENRGNVIIIQENNSLIKNHQVSELPFPFNNVKDHEATMRAPVGRDFIPEKPHRTLINPSVKTKMGKVIEPIDENLLLKV